MAVDEKVYEAAIVGGGPAGLTAALYLSRAQIRTVVLESQFTGGKIAMSDWIDNYPGFRNGISGMDLMKEFREQAERFGSEIAEFKNMESLIKDGAYWKLASEDGEQISALAVLVSTGTSPAKLGIAGEEKFYGRGVSYCAKCDANFFKGKPVVVIGGGNSAVEESVYLAKFASRVYLVHRRDRLRASAAVQSRAEKEPAIELVLNSIPKSIDGENSVSGVSVSDVSTGKERFIEAGGVFMYVGNVPNTQFLKGLLDCDEAGFILTDDDMRSSEDGIFAAGDVRSNRLKQVLTAAAEGAVASEAMRKYVDNLKGTSYD